LSLVSCLFFAPAGARYDAFKAEVADGLDHVAIGARGRASAGELGQSVYPSKVDGEGLDIFIPTTHYVRLGAGANLGFASDGFDIGGTETDFDWGLSQHFAIGCNFSSMFRGELGWGHSDMRFAEMETKTAMDAGRVTVFMDLARRYVLEGDVTYRKHLVPFIGIGGTGARTEFNGADGIPGATAFAYGGHAAAGLSFAFSETNALDLTVSHEILFTKGHFGWDEELKRFGYTNISLSWRSSF
jgi:hypothetical protein